jgi:hypothetical protein
MMAACRPAGSATTWVIVLDCSCKNEWTFGFMVALRRSAAGARTTGLAGTWLERDEAILVNLGEADEYAREYVVARVGSGLRAAAPARVRAKG